MKKLSDFSSKYRETEILNKSKYGIRHLYIDSAILIQELKT